MINSVKIKTGLCEVSRCTGCGACENSCPNSCISMIKSEEGFLYPHISSEECERCGNCVKSCPVLHPLNIVRLSEPTVYACWHENEVVRAQSSSGGAFSAFAEVILADGGIVYGAAYDDNLHVRHVGIGGPDGLQRLRGSKYVQSDMGSTFKEIKFHLKNERKVLFVGTPCQVAGLYGYLGKDNGNLLTADLICHGVPSPLVFKKYISSLEAKYNTVFEAINFRDKRHGWENISVFAVSKEKKEYPLKGKLNSFYNGFILSTFLRESCYQCPYIGMPRIGTVTLADFWGIRQSAKVTQKEIDRGISLLMLNSHQKAHRIISLCKDRLVVEERSLEEAKTGNSPMCTPALRPANREQFFEDINKLNFDSLAERYLVPSFKRRIVQIFKENFPASSLAGLRKLKKTLRI